MSEQFDEYQVEQFEQAAYQGAMLEAGKEWERQRDEYDLHEAEWQASAEKAEAMIERLIDAGNALYLAGLPDGHVIGVSPTESEWADWDSLVVEYQSMKGGEG